MVMPESLEYYANVHANAFVLPSFLFISRRLVAVVDLVHLHG